MIEDNDEVAGTGVAKQGETSILTYRRGIAVQVCKSRFGLPSLMDTHWYESRNSCEFLVLPNPAVDTLPEVQNRLVKVWTCEEGPFDAGSRAVDLGVVKRTLSSPLAQARLAD